MDNLYAATIASGSLYVNEIELDRNENDVLEIYADAKRGCSVIIDADLNRLEAIASQLGLAFVPEGV